MPPNGPVYQPTTVTYEQQESWTPISYLSQTATNVKRSRFMLWVFLLAGPCCFVIGLVLVIKGAIDYNATEVHEEGDEKTMVESGRTEDLVTLIVGLVFILVGLALPLLYVRQMRQGMIGCPWYQRKEQWMARQMESQGGNGQILTLNPSTDLLVTSQYAPASEVAYQVPVVSDEEETRKLMGSDNKECIEDNERMLESDPRIVLRPKTNTEEA